MQKNYMEKTVSFCYNVPYRKDNPMVTKKNVLWNLSEISLPKEINHIEKCLFMDIETTGFTAKGSYLYLIGCVYVTENHFESIQWLAESNEEEVALLNAFAEFAAPFTTLIHYNGNRFDVPYLTEKYVHFGLSNPLADKEGLDLFRRIEPYKTFLRLPDCKQKTIETFLNVDREDVLSGRELIGVYLQYTQTHEDREEDLLLLHNADDIAGLVRILPILSYVELCNMPLTVTKVAQNAYSSFDGTQTLELLMKVKFPSPLPVQINVYNKGCYLTGIGSEGCIKVPVYHGELKYFYANYRDYYYLPDEDCALHKSISAFVDPSHRQKATKENCYTRKEGDFLPQWDAYALPFFKKEYKSKEMYFELTEGLKQDREFFNGYASHVLLQMLK